MNGSKSTNLVTKQSQILLNGYKISNLQDLRWKAAIYELKPTSATAIPTHASAKQVMWDFKRANRSFCPGMGFIVEVNETTVAIPAEWTIPSGTLGHGFTFHRLEEVEVSGANTRWTVLFSRIVKDALRSHLKKVGPQVLGPLWMDYGTLCQLPTEKTANGFAFCRRFDFDPKPLANGAWALRFVASTACIDADSIAHYYEGGTVTELAEMVHAKISQRTNRRGRPVAVRVLHGTKQGENRSARVLDVFSPEQILDEAKLRASEQKERAGLALQCNDFIDGTVAVSKSQCHLILDTQITQDDHDETILEPGQRAEWAGRLRDLCNGCEIFGAKLIVAESPLSSDDFDSSHILPPPVHVRDSFGMSIIDSPAAATADALRDRAKLRDSHIRKFGFYEHRPIAPLLALPARMSDNEGDIVQALLNQLLEERNIPFRIPEPIFYKDVAGLQRAVEERKCDSLLAVLPEGRRQAYSTHDTHEDIKRRIPVPSQCIYHDNALPFPLRGMSLEEGRRREPKLARRMSSQLDLCLLNLLVKAQWFPFIPAERANYNVHIGLDVGGKLNSTVVASIGYGFGNPNGGFLFKPVEIDMNSHHAEPVHPDVLFHGLLRLVEETRAALEGVGDEPDFDRVLFMRDGQLLGAGEDWNEIDALKRLFDHCRSKGWIGDSALWTAVELMKAGDGWRVFERKGQWENPIVGFCCYPFPDPNEGLLCTTGQPYLTQGTAMPLKFRIHEIAGKADRAKVVRDLVWEADMCFTKPDMGQSFPWTLHIADTGALHLSRSYRISGVPV